MRWIRSHTTILCSALGLLLLLSVVLCIGIGPVPISFTQVWRVILYQLLGWGEISDIPVSTQNIVWFLRAPRVLLGGMVGVFLTLSGVGMQAFTRNPLADPYVLGISSGASCGAVVAMITGLLHFLGRYATATGAFCGALLSIVLVYFLARSGHDISPIRLILIGVAISSLFSALTSYLVYSAPNDAQVREATFWMMGGLAGVKWEYLLPAGILLFPAILIMYCLSTAMNALLMGENTAITLGIPVSLVSRLLIGLTALMTAVSVAVSGCIGFVGMVIPHVIRSLVGSDHRRVVPLSALTGSIFMMWVDVGARMLDAPGELPIGIITALIGAPFFLWLIRVRRYAFGKSS